MLRRQPNIPEWLTQVMKELTRPPYFLEHLHTQNQSTIQEKGEHSVTPSTSGSSQANSVPSTSAHRPPSPSTRPYSFYPAHQGPQHKGESEVASVSKRKRSSQTAASQPANSPQQEFVATAATVSEKGSGKTPAAWQTVFRKANIPVSLVKAYGWNIRRAQPLANVVRVETKGGTYVLKPTHLSPHRVEFLHNVFAYLEDQGFSRFAPFVLTKQNRNPYAVRKNQTYYASQWMPGNQSNFSSLQQAGLIAQTLAQFHEMTRGYELEGYSPPMEYGLSSMFRRRTEDLRALLVRAEARSPADDFDKLLLKLGPQLRADAESSIRQIEDEKCERFLSSDSEYPGLCHLDVIPGNFIYGQQQAIHAIDFDLATYAPRVLDLSHLLRRTLERQNWQSNVAYTCFVQYNDTRAIRPEEYQLVHALLLFPYRAWRLAHTRYRVSKDQLQVQELQEYAIQEERRQNFLTEYARQISHLK